MRERLRLIYKFIAIFIVVNIVINPFVASKSIAYKSNNLEKNIPHNVKEVKVSPEAKSLNVQQAVDNIIEVQEDDLFREETNIEEDVVIYVISQKAKVGEKPEQLSDISPFCKKFGMYEVEYITEFINEVTEDEIEYYVTYKAHITEDVWKVVDELNACQEIIGAEPCYTYETTGTISEVPTLETAPYMQMQWYLDELSMTQNWEAMEKNGIVPGAGITIAVIDTGVNTSHEALKKSLWINEGEMPGNGIDDDSNGFIDDYNGVNMIDPSKSIEDDNGHGTSMSSIIAMQGCGGKSGSGIAYGSKIMTVKAANAKGEFNQDDVAKSINYAVAMKADIINMSFGGTRSVVIEIAAKNAYKKGVIMIAAAGNEGIPTSDSARWLGKDYQVGDVYPAASPYVVGVMAHNQHQRLCSFSNWDYIRGSAVEYNIIAPGANLYAADIGSTQKYGYSSGTSAATAVVAAIAACYKSIYQPETKYNHVFIIRKLVSKNYVTYTDILGKAHYYNKVSSDLKHAAETVGMIELNTCKAVTDSKVYKYTGEAIEPKLTVMYEKVILQEGKHYTIEYDNNIHIGTCSITLKPVDKVSYGKLTLKVNIVPPDIANQKVEYIKRSGKEIAIESEEYLETGAVRITWEKDRLNDGYEIYKMADDEKKYTLVAKIEDETVEEYIDKSIKLGTEYTYRIRGYKEVNGVNYYSSFIKDLKVFTKMESPVLSSMSNVSGSIHLVWSKVKSATGYELFKFNEETKKYEKIIATDVNTNFYLDTELMPLKKYFYVVRAIKEKGLDVSYGYYSDKLRAYSGPTKVGNLAIASESGGKMLLAWEPVKGATGYQIYIADTPDGEYRLLSGVSPQSIKVRVIKVPKNKVLYYKIRAYKRIGEKVVLGDFSDVRYAKAY